MIKEIFYKESNKNNYKVDFNVAYTSLLVRAQNTLAIILDNMNLKINVIENVALNERDYGDLIGQNKAEAAEKFGVDQVQKWRRSYDIPPPGGESLEMTCARTLPYFVNTVMKEILDNQSNVIVSAHGNSIRAIVKFLFKYDPDTILKTEIGWCEPWYFKFNQDGDILEFKLLGVDIDKSNSNIPVLPVIRGV